MSYNMLFTPDSQPQERLSNTITDLFLCTRMWAAVMTKRKLNTTEFSQETDRTVGKTTTVLCDHKGVSFRGIQQDHTIRFKIKTLSLEVESKGNNSSEESTIKLTQQQGKDNQVR